jgi:tetratricopeptide (TPR) repeat protein
MTDAVDLVRHYLRAQNLEQLGRIDEAIELYERALKAGFDSAGPYDRLIHLYAGRAAHGEVIRVAEAALVSVRTHEAKRAWYATMRDEARRALASLPRPVPRRPDRPEQP